MRSKLELALDHIKQHGIVEPWQRFGVLLSRDGAISTQLVEVICQDRLTEDATHNDRVRQLFSIKLENLTGAIGLLDSVMSDYDHDGEWEVLDRVVTAMNLHQAVDLLSPDFMIHPFPVVLRSLEFNWGYMQRHGVRQFYLMTKKYLEKLQQITREALCLYERELQTGIVSPYWLIHLDLVSIETPTHCDVCRMTIALVLALMEVECVTTDEHVNEAVLVS